MNYLIPLERIENRIYLIRGQKVMLDFDLAELYGVETKQLKRQVKRNIQRFPQDFMFQLSEKEEQSLRCQFGTSRSSHGGRRYFSYAFTEQGVAMLSSVLKSAQAIEVNIAIMRAFVRLRQILSTHKELSQKFKELEGKVKGHDKSIQAIFDVIRQLMQEPEKPKRRIGFLVK